MIATAFSKDVLRVYALAMAYLHDAKIGNQGATSDVQVEEIAPARFHIWHAEQIADQKLSIAPAAVCTYNSATQTWKVKLASGEGLTLLDKESVWELVEETKKKTVRKGAKKQRRVQ